VENQLQNLCCEIPNIFQIDLEHSDQTTIRDFSGFELIGINEALMHYCAQGWKVSFEPAYGGGCAHIPPRVFLSKQ
jgi:hypothetical protein